MADEIAGCEPVGTLTRTLTVECGITVFPSLATSGIELTGTATSHIMSDGSIERIPDTIEWEPAIEFRTAFEQWLQETHPRLVIPQVRGGRWG
jgi:hypothetical protein